MMVAGRLIGMLDVYTTTERRFEKWGCDLFSTFANYAALSISTFARRQQLERLIELLRDMTTATSVDSLLNLFLERGLRLVGATRGWISRLDLRNGNLQVACTVGNPTHRRTLQWGEGITGTAVERGVPVNVGDVTAPEWEGVYVEFWPDTRSELAIPIMVANAEVRDGTKVRRGARLLGALNVESPRLDAFSQTSENLLWSLAQHAAIAIEKLEFDDRLARLRNIEKTIGQLETFDETAKAVLEAVKTSLEYDFVNISLVNVETGRIKTEYVTGIPDDLIEKFKQMADHSVDSDDIQAHIYREGVAEVPPRKVPAGARFQFDPEIYERFGHENLIRVFVPMRLPQGNRVVGTIEAGYNQTYRRYIYERDVNMLQGFADYAALALEHKRLFSFDFLMAGVLARGLAAVGAGQGSLLMLNKDTNVLEVIERKGRPYAPGNVKLEVGKGIAGLAVRDRRPYREADIARSRDFIRPAKGTPTFRSMLVVPLIQGDRCIGAICAHAEDPDRFSEADEKRLVDFCQSIAPTIEQLGVDAFIGHTKRLKQLERFRGVAEELGRLTVDSVNLREQIVKAAESILDANPVVLYEYDDEKKAFETPPTLAGDLRHRRAMTGGVFDRRAPHLIVEKGDSHYATTAQSDDIMTGGSPSAARPSFVEREGIVSSAGILLQASNRTVGVLFLNYRHRHAFSSHDKHIIAGFAADVALALQEARAVREAMRKSHQSALEQNRQAVAHRLKGPLTSMNRRLVAIRAKSNGHPDVQHLAIQASELNRHVQRLIVDLNAPATRTPPERYALLVRDDLELLLTRALAANKTYDDTETRVQLDTALPAIRVDREALEDDFIGLLHDSERHRGGAAVVTVEGRLARRQDVEGLELGTEGPFVMLIYRDNGPGVRDELKEKIFERSFTTAIDGTGLGLAIARDNCVRHGGWLRERGRYGAGALFEMCLPAYHGSGEGGGRYE
jgi:GAF domain-containing protein